MKRQEKSATLTNLLRQHYSGASPKLTSSLTTIPPCDPEPSESNDRVRELQSLRYANKSLTQSIYDFQKLVSLCKSFCSINNIFPFIRYNKLFSNFPTYLLFLLSIFSIKAAREI